jgi:predicted PurR-regulated permease PerM
MKQNGSKSIHERLADYSKYTKTFTLVVVIFIFLFCMKAASAVIIPIAFAIFVLLIIYPLLEKLDKLRVPFWISNAIGMILFITFIALLVWLMMIIVQTLATGLPTYANKVEMLDHLLTARLSSIMEFQKGDTLLSGLNVDWLNIVLSGLSNISTQFVSILKNILLIILFLFFLLAERRTLVPKTIEAFSKDQSNMIIVITERVTKQVSRYLFIKFAISTVTGLLFFSTAYVTGLDFAPLWGVSAFVLNFIPSIGSLIVTISTIIMAIIQFTPDVVPIIYVAILAVSIQMVVGNIIDPRLQGIQLGLSPLVLLLSLSLWGYIWGIPGMFLAVPLASIIQIFCINIPSLRPIAIMIGSGKSIRRKYKKEKKLKKNTRKTHGLKRSEKLSKEAIDKQADEIAKNTTNLNDFILPDSLDLDDK